MVNTINFIGDTGRTTYHCASFNSLIVWLGKRDIIAFDTETNVTESILDRQLKVLAIANEDGNEIWVIQFDHLDIKQQFVLLDVICSKLCIIQNVAFDYQVLLRYGHTLRSVHDTMLAEQILYTGLKKEPGFHGLQGIYQRRFNLDISKAEQLTFGDTDQYTDEQIEYAATDVLKLGVLRKLQISEMQYRDKELEFGDHRGLTRTLWWENQFALATGDMETNGIRLDREQWYTIEDSIKPTWIKEAEQLNKIAKESFKDVLLDNGYLYDQDTFVTKIWSSAKKKLEVLNEVFTPALEKTSAIELKKYLKENDPDFPEGLPITGKAWNASEYRLMLNTKYAIIKLLILATGEQKEEMYEHLNVFLLTNLKDLCIEKGWLVPAGKTTIKWTSPAQRIKIFRAIDPFIESTRKEELEDYIDKHEIISHYLKWNEVDYQLKNFGKSFYDDWVELDGKHRTRFNAILSTGRLSSVKPNILNIPRKNDVFREAVIPDPGYLFINSDFDGQEMVITATLSGEESWLKTLALKQDLHSRNAELVFGQEWIDATEEGCAYYRETETGPQYHKCKCSRHQELRDAVKTIGFGILYGMSEYAASARLDISVDAARALIKKFFEIAPKVKELMERFGEFALDREYIVEPVFGRVRYFDKWKIVNSAEHGSVRRKAYNFPIQAAGSALLKIAIVLLRRAINNAGLRDEIQILMPYHDEISIQATPPVAEIARRMLEDTMRKAGKVAGFPLLNASAAVGESWFDAH